MLDKIRFAQALDEFLIKMDKVLNTEHPALQDALTSICHVLRISQVRIIIYEMKNGERLQGKKITILYRSEQFDAVRFQQVTETLGGGSEVVFRVYQNLGEESWNEDELKRIHVFLRLVSTFFTRAREKEIIQRLTFYDREMNIHNLNYFMQILHNKAKAECLDRYGASYFNLKRFSLINDDYGRDMGTKILCTYIEKLQEIIGENGIVCRVGGDNFIALFPKDKIDQVWRHLQGWDFYMEELKEEKVTVEASAGYYMIPDGCSQIELIMDCLSAAVQVARNEERDRYAFYDEQFALRREKVRNIERAFPDAIDHEEFVVFYQPQISIDTGRIVGAEALCRWVHDGKIIAPNEFIPILEQSRRICELDFYILERVCRDIRRWLDEGRDIVRISVNMSRVHLSANNILGHIIFVLDHYQIPHQYIEIELTETTTDVNFDNLKRLVTGLRNAGIYTAIDDFGIGYSSLNLIRQAPWNVLKLDKSLIPKDVSVDAHQSTMLKYLISMSREIGLLCVAEGVETKEQLELLGDYGCDVVQGYYFSKPVPVEEFEEKWQNT